MASLRRHPQLASATTRGFDHLAGAAAIDVRVAADLQLEPVDALGATRQHVLGHLLG
jgi:hypothetical protein